MLDNTVELGDGFGGYIRLLHAHNGESVSSDDDMLDGAIRISVRYDSASGNLLIKVFEVRSMRGSGNPQTLCDPYVKMYVLPDKGKKTKMKTHLKRKTSSPSFEEKFSVPIPQKELGSKTLSVSVWADHVLHNQEISHLELPLSSVPIDTSVPLATRWYLLTAKPMA